MKNKKSNLIEITQIDNTAMIHFPTGLKINIRAKVKNNQKQVHIFAVGFDEDDSVAQETIHIIPKAKNSIVLIFNTDE